MGSANHDERAYAHADRFDLFREVTAENKVLAFGEGIHSCMGAPLARLTAQVAVEELLAVLDGTELRVTGVPERWAKQMVRGFSRLPVRLVPAGLPPHSMRLAAIRPRDVESVQQRTTRLTLTRREFEAVVRVEAKTPAAEDVVALTLREATGQPLPPWEPGAHVDLILDGVATRQYSLCGPPGDLQAYRLGILRDPGGSGGSLHVHDKLAAGDLVRIRGPRNNFPLAASPRYLFIAGGIGITPMLPMIEAASRAGAQWRLVYGGRRRSSMAFLGELAAHGDRVTVWPQDEHGFLPLADLLGTPQPGTCGTCETPVLDGEPDHRDSVLDPGQRAAGDCMMICVSRSCTSRLVLDL